MSKRNAILAAATHLFSKNGFKETSMSELSDITGAARGTIFHHFKNKEDLFLQILEMVQENITRKFNDYKKTTTVDNGMDQIEKDITFYLNLSEELKEEFLLLHRHYPYQIAESNSRCRECLVAIYDELLKIFEDGIQEGMEDGTVKKCSARNTAMILFALVDGIARFNTYQLYNAGALYQDLMNSCKHILTQEARP